MFGGSNSSLLSEMQTTASPLETASGQTSVWLHSKMEAGEHKPIDIGVGGLFALDLSLVDRHMRMGSSSGTGSISACAQTDENGWLIATLPGGICVMLPGLNGTVKPAPCKSEPDDGVLDPAFRHGYWFYILGSAAPDLFKHGCEIDMRTTRFGDSQAQQTLLFRTSVTVIRDDMASVPGYHILGCSSYAEHMASNIQTYQSRYGGCVIDRRDLIRLQGEMVDRKIEEASMGRIRS